MTYRKGLLLVLLASATFYATFIARSLFHVGGILHATQFDDAMISMRYARNLAAGDGLVWNPGAAAVQGFTNPAWTFVMAGVHDAGTPPRLAALVVMIIGAAILLMLAVETARLARFITEDDGLAVAAAAFSAASYAVVFWTLRGMEVGLLALLGVVATRAAIAYVRFARPGDLVLCGIMLIGALWTRPDALVMSAVLGAYLLWYAPRGRSRVVAVACVVGALGIATPLLASQFYYGSLFPNTYYLKLGGTTLSDRAGRGLASFLSLTVRSLAAALLAVAALPIDGWLANRRLPRDLGLLSAIVSVQCLYSISVGGDAWEWMGYANRYVAIVLPFLMILTAAGLRAVVRHPRAALLGGAGCLAVIGLHVCLVFYLIRSHRGIDGRVIDAYRADPIAVVGILLACGTGAALVTAIATVRRSFAAFAVVVWLLINGVPTGRWVLQNGFMITEDRDAARVGLLIHETLAPEATFAISWAGSIPYFAGRTAVDLLGKSDPIIARMPPAISEFVPGHNKWNLRYSIGQLRPDLACNLPRRPGDTDYLRAEGYHPIGATCFVRAGARLDESRLTAGLAAIYPGSITAAQEPAAR